MNEHHASSIAAARLGTTQSPETRAKIAAAMTGRKHSPETRAKIAAARRRRHGTETPEQRDARIQSIRNGIAARTPAKKKVTKAKRARVEHREATLIRLAALAYARHDSMTPEQRAAHSASISAGHARRRVKRMGADLLQLVPGPPRTLEQRMEDIVRQANSGKPVIRGAVRPTHVPPVFKFLFAPRIPETATPAARAFLSMGKTVIPVPAATLATLRKWTAATYHDDTAPATPFRRELLLSHDIVNARVAVHGFRQIRGERHHKAATVPMVVVFTVKGATLTEDTVLPVSVRVIHHDGPPMELTPWPAEAGQTGSENE
jgi:hypothetical protein